MIQIKRDHIHVIPKGTAGTEKWRDVVREMETKAVCAVCQRVFDRAQLRSIVGVSPGVAALIRVERPDMARDALLCREDLSRYRSQYLGEMLRDEEGELSHLDREVITSLRTGMPVAEDIETVFEERRTFGERAADGVASFGGSWTFICIFGCVLVVWMGINVAGVLGGGFDPYPFILLNLLLSCIAAVQAPIIMMSQRRTESKDRMRAENDYKVNLKAELEIRHLHDRFDYHLALQWERLIEMQRMQIEMLEEAARDARTARPVPEE